MGVEKDLNEQQKRFYEEYLIDYNATQAAIRAGYSKKSAHAQGCTLLKHPKGSAYLCMLIKKTSEKLEITRERVLKELARIGFANLDDVFTDWGVLKEYGKVGRGVKAAISGVKITTFTSDAGTTVTKDVKFHDKHKALESLSKHLGLFEADNSQKGAEIIVKRPQKKK